MLQVMIFVYKFNIVSRNYKNCRLSHIFFNYSTGNRSDTLELLLNRTFKMPKSTPHTDVLKRHRQRLKEKGLKYTPGTVNLQVIGSGAKGAPRSLYMFTDQSRYLFNCGEGSQRLAHEHKRKLSKLEHIFITHPIWENVGGLPGMALTIQDMGVPEINLHGPPGTDEIFLATRRFVVLRYLAVKSVPCERGSFFQDNVLKVHYVPLYSPAGMKWLHTPPSERSRSKSPDWSYSGESTDDDIDYYAYWNRGNRSRSNSSSPNSSPTRNKKRRHLSPDSTSSERDLPPPGSVSMAYICHLHDRPGTLDLRACVARGVTPGPLLGKLKGGEDVTLPDGTLVRSRDVTSPLEKGPVFVVLECPNEEFLDNLLNEELFEKHQAQAANEADMAYMVVHFSPRHIMEHPRYKEWMSRFPLSTHHLILNETNNCQGSIAVHRIQHKLHMLSQKIFPLLADSGFPSTEDQGVSSNGESDLRKSFSIVKGITLNTIHLRPRSFLSSTPKLQLEPEVYRQETMDTEGFPDALATLKQQLAKFPDDEKLYPLIVFLGTGSSIPNKTRNTSGILVQLSESNNMILDCGEATYGQIVRLFGSAHTDTILRDLSAVYISHLHADHHIGLAGLLKARLQVCEPTETLFLLAPRQIRIWLNVYHTHFEPVLTGVTLIPNDKLLYSDFSLEPNKQLQMLDKLGLSDVRTCIVDHCPNAFGVAVTHPHGWKMTYSGDTMPCDELIKLGKGCDLLIHEATMEDNLESEAKLKMHSTTSQAVEVGRKMEAKFTLLTHFSQRYAKVPLFNESFTSDVGIAFDNMQVRFCDLPKLPLMYPTLKQMFAEHYEEMEMKAWKRQMHLEREMARAST